MLSAIMQRFPSDYISRLKQIGLVFFEKIATDPTIAGETQDFYQGLLVGFDRAVKLIDEEDGVRSLNRLEAKLATLIDTEAAPLQQSSSLELAPGNWNSSLCRLSHSYIAQLRQVGTETDFDATLEECICPTETQDFYHGCIAALDFAISLAGEKYAYAQISLLKTNAAYFIDLSKDQERQVRKPNIKGLPSLKGKDLPRNQGSLGNWVQVGHENYPTNKVEQDNTESFSIQEESPDIQTIEPEDREEEESTFNELNASRHIGQQILNLLESDIHTNDELEEGRVNFPVPVEEPLSTLEEEQRLEIETLLVGILLDNSQTLKQGKLDVIEEWTAFLEDGEAIRVISSPGERVVLRVSLDGEVQSALSYKDAAKLSAAIEEKYLDFELSATTLTSAVANRLENDFSTDSVLPSAAMDIEQIKLAESILPIAEKAFEYVLNYAPERVQENDEYTRVRLGNSYELIVTESEGVLVSSLVASRRGELIRVCGDNLSLARSILPEDIKFWSTVAKRLEQIDAMHTEDCADADKSNDIEI